jgi:hypothetical protein
MTDTGEEAIYGRVEDLFAHNVRYYAGLMEVGR